MNLKNAFASIVVTILALLPKISDSEITLINTRRSYYPTSLGKLFENKGVYYWEKVEDRIFKILDPNYYLFSSHPREND